MDPEVLVKSGQALVKAMDAAGFAPRAALWIFNPEAEDWKLWLVPPKGTVDKRDFYRRVAEIITANREDLPGIEVSDTEMIPDNHPAMVRFKVLVRAEGLTSAFFERVVMNGYLLPKCIVLRVAL